MSKTDFNLQSRLLSKIKEYWLDWPMHTFFIKLVTLVKSLQILSNYSSNMVIGIYAKNSFNWILLYFATIFAGFKLVLYPRHMSNEALRHAVMNDGVGFLFIDDSNKEQLLVGRKALMQKRMFLLKGIFDINTFAPLIYSEKVNELVKLFEISIRVDLNIPHTLELADIDSLANKYFSNTSNSTITSYTSGTTNGIKKAITLNENEIERVLFSLAHSGLASKIEFNDSVFSNVPYSESHILTVLFPFYQGAKYSFDHYFTDANVVIEDTSSFEKMWEHVVDSLMEGRFLNNILRKKTFRWLYKRLIKKRLHLHYHHNTKKTAIIIYNSFVHERAIFEAKDKLPLITTYGMQEAGQIIAYNDFSVPTMHRPNCVGTIVPNVNVSINPKNKEIILDIKGKTLYTKDVGSLIPGHTNYLFVYGRTMARKIDSFGLPVQLDNLERYIRGLPYIKQCVIVQRVQRETNYFALLIEPNVSFIDAKMLNMQKVSVLLKAYVKNITRLKEINIVINNVVVLPKPLLKISGTNQVLRYIYGGKLH